MKVLPRICEGLAAASPERAWKVVAMQTDAVVRSEAAAMTLAVWAAKDEATAMAQFEAAASTLDLAAFLAALPRTGHVGTPTRSTAFGDARNIAPLKDRATILQAQGPPP